MLFKNSDDCNGKVFVSRRACDRAGVACDGGGGGGGTRACLAVGAHYREMGEAVRRLEGALAGLQAAAGGSGGAGGPAGGLGPCGGERARVLRCYEERVRCARTNCSHPVEAFVRCVRGLALHTAGDEECDQR